MPGVPRAIDHHKHRAQQISTGLCIFLFIVLVAYPVYTLSMSVTKTITIAKPTLTTFVQLYSAYPEMLICSCNNPSINYGEFVSIQYTLHQVCQSDFVTHNWISYLAMSTDGTQLSYDFRSTSSSSFQALTTFCDLIQATIDDSLSRFYSTQYISLFVKPLPLFQAEIQASIAQLTSSTINSFLLSLSMIRGTMQSNALLSSLQTNYKQTVQNDEVSSFSQTYNGCDCASSAACTLQSAIYAYPNGISLFNIPGFYTGCYVIESLLQSNLQCWFNRTCIDELQTYLSLSTFIEVTALNPLLPSQFSEDATIQQLVEGMMIEQWNTSLMYNAYYNACQPVQCSYSSTTRNDATYIATMLIGVVGGLIAILNLIVPRLVRFIVHVFRKRNTRVAPEMSLAQT